MRVVIIEDEIMTAEDLASIVLKLPYNITIVAMLHSIAEAKQFFKTNPVVDLIFCDIQLGDGYSFEIFTTGIIETPVIFCTAFNEYALQAFDNNGIAYVLKPFTAERIAAAVEKYKKITAAGSPGLHLNKMLQEFAAQANTPKQETSLLVNWRNEIIPVRYQDIAIFGIENKLIFLVTFSNQKYFVSQVLDELEQLAGPSFYRANRQFLINKSAVQTIRHYGARKLSVDLSVAVSVDVTIPKNKVPEFLNWLKS